MKKPGLTVERIDTLNGELRLIRNRLIQIEIEIENAYARTRWETKAARCLEKARRYMADASEILRESYESTAFGRGR